MRPGGEAASGQGGVESDALTRAIADAQRRQVAEEGGLMQRQFVEQIGHEHIDLGGGRAEAALDPDGCGLDHRRSCSARGVCLGVKRRVAPPVWAVSRAAPSLRSSGDPAAVVSSMAIRPFRSDGSTSLRRRASP